MKDEEWAGVQITGKLVDIRGDIGGVDDGSSKSIDRSVPRGTSFYLGWDEKADRFLRVTSPTDSMLDHTLTRLDFILFDGFQVWMEG